MSFNQKEQGLLKDLSSEEQLCIDKYAKYQDEACQHELKDLFAQIGQQEQAHLNTLRQLMADSPPPAPSGAEQGAEMPAPASYQDQELYRRDLFLCSDALATEKHVSSLYDTCIFEFKDQAVRNALNHIQKEEQEHGKKIYDYMAVNGMYN